MTSNTTFKDNISPKDDFKEVFVGDKKLFVNKDTMVCHENDEVMCVAKSKEDGNIIDLYAKLLGLTSHSENVYKELIKKKGHVESCADFQREFCDKYNISRLTFVRALNELCARGIVVNENRKVTVASVYNIYEASINAKSLLIIVKTT